MRQPGRSLGSLGDVALLAGRIDAFPFVRRRERHLEGGESLTSSGGRRGLERWEG